MTTKIEANADIGSSDVSFIRGGPFYHILQALRLIYRDRWEFSPSDHIHYRYWLNAITPAYI
jgi:hypothetical protein